MSSSFHRLRRGWSELQAELLELILEKLNLADHARFASVCPSWRSVAINNPPIDKPLYMALSHDPERLGRRFITSFIPSWEAARFIGALDGWLVILIDGRDLFLLNKGFNSVIPMPSPPKNVYLYKAVLSSPPSSSSGECAVVISNHCAVLSYCRLGSDNSFTYLVAAKYVIRDFQFYEGQLYVLCDSNTIIIFDHLFNKVTQLVADLGDIPLLVRSRFLDHLLISENKLLMIAKWLNPSRVFEFELSKSRVVPLKKINENLLMLNNLCSVSITADKHKEFRPRGMNIDYYRNKHGTCVLYMGKEPYEATVGDPWPLFFSMFKEFGIKNDLSKV